MWQWILIFLSAIILLAILEETIQFFVNRSIFGPSELENTIREWVIKLKKKLKFKKSPS